MPCGPKVRFIGLDVHTDIIAMLSRLVK